MIETSMTFDQAGLNEFSSMLKQLTSVCGYDREKAVRMATVDLLKSVRASTKKSASIRKIRSVRVSKKFKQSGNLLPFKMEKYDRKSDQKLEQWIFAGSLAEAKQLNVAKIRYSGLARTAWNWAMRDLFETGDVSAPFRRPSGAVVSEKSGDDIDQVIKITNKIEYVMSAFQTSGDRAISTATARAANTLRKHIERKLEAARK